MSLQIGTKLAHYEIVAPIGAGGMGEVYKARDARLDRTVAVKVLRETDPDRLRRFEQEARAASALNHPNIVTIHEIGVHEGTPFIAMEYVDGVTLREVLSGGPLANDKLMRFATQMAEGLSKAHQARIVHRDLKPENIIISADGYVKILDFGLAKLLPGRDVGSEVATLAKVTTPGTILGTVGYMSPEQAKGQPADFRSDQFSLGAILYEMATGKHAFERDSVPQTLAALLRDEPESIDALNAKVPALLGSIVRRCLEKDPAKRYAETGDLSRALKNVPEVERFRLDRRLALVAAAGVVVAGLAILFGLDVGDLRDRWIGEAGPGTIRAIAVLPLKNLSGDPRQEYYSDGITESLISDLAKVEALKVISRTSVMLYKDNPKPLPEIAEELGVDAIVEGSVVPAGDRLRISVRLIHAKTDQNLWAEQYDREMHNVLELQSDVARAIVREIQITLTPDEENRLASAGPVDPGAYRAYLQGRHHHNKGTPDDLTQAMNYFQQAIEADPDFALPYAYLAHAFVLAGGAVGPLLPPRVAMREARAMADKALEIDPNLSEVYAALGYELMGFEWEWSAAETALERAIALNPGSSDAHHLFASYLSRMGRHEEALAEIERALQLDPLNLRLRFTSGLLLYFARQNEEAIQTFQTLLSLNPQFGLAHRGLALVYIQKRMYEKAIVANQTALDLSGRRSLNDLSGLAAAHAAVGDTVEAKRLLQEIELSARERQYDDPFVRVYVFIMLGDADQAFYWLGKSIDEHHVLVSWLKVNPYFDPLRKDPRFPDLLTRVNFE